MKFLLDTGDFDASASYIEVTLDEFTPFNTHVKKIDIKEEDMMAKALANKYHEEIVERNPQAEAYGLDEAYYQGYMEAVKEFAK